MRFGDEAMSYAKKNPQIVAAGLISFVTLILIAVAIFSLYKVDLTKISDETQKKYVTNAKRSAVGVGVMTLISAALYGMYMMKKK